MDNGTGLFKKGLRALFGALQWDAPPWIVRLGEVRQGRPRQFWGGIAIIAFLPLLVVGGYRLWQMLPQPVLTQVEVVVPGVTRVGADGKLYPQPARLKFSAQYSDAREEGPRNAARLALLGKPLLQGIKLEPELRGQWQWVSERELRFEPEDDWPAGQRYQVVLQPELFADGVTLADSRPSFVTPDLKGRLKKLDFYQDPENPSVHKVVATVAFTHAVQLPSVKEHLRLTMRASGDAINKAPKDYDYELRLGKHQREAYIATGPLTLPTQENFMTLTLTPGVAAALGDSVTAQALTDKVVIPAVSTFFRVSSMTANTVRNEKGDPEQTIVAEFTDGVKTEVIAKSIKAWELPDNRHWGRSDINEALLSRSRKLTLQGNPTEREYAKLQSFRFQAAENRQVLIQLPAGLISEGGFEMAVPYTEFLNAPMYPREAQIVGEGALLAMTGDRTLSLQARGMPALQVELFRLMDEQAVHLITQTHGDLEQANFNYNFGEENISERFERVLNLSMNNPAEAAYASLDLAPFLQKAGRGLFIVRVYGWDPVKQQRVYGAEDRRLVLVTDLSLIAKTNADYTHSLFVHSLDRRGPVADATIELLGRNGQPVMTVVTDEEGHASLPDVRNFQQEREPTVYWVRRGNDIAFLPFNRYGRHLDYSRFDTGGLRSRDSDAGHRLRAAVFSDRGIYRPGEEGHLGIMVKQEDWQSVKGVPVEVILSNPRGNIVLRETVALPADGFVELPLSFAAVDPTGQYQAQVYLLDDRRRRLQQLGQASLSVEEFQPDTMRIRTELLGADAPGWQTSVQYQGQVILENLFGLPAQERRVQASYTLQPAHFRFQAYPGFVFEDPFRQDGKALKTTVSKDLAEGASDAQGKALFDIDLSAYGRGLFRLGFAAQGYETGGGRSVSARSSTLVSPAEQLVGWKADGALNYLRRDAERNIAFVAINPQLKTVTQDGLTLTLSERRSISSLVRQNDGTLTYQTVVKEVPVSAADFEVKAGGSDWRLPTETPGDYVAELRNGTGLPLARIQFSVVGAQNIGGRLEKNAELDLKLDRFDYRNGQEIELQITAPYTGAGLITIEKDKVYTYQWFRADTTRSVQRIRVPEGLEGNGYVNVTFVRALDSEEIFTRPLSYAVAPFNIDREKQTIDIALEVPDKVKPGAPLTVEFQTSRPGRIAVFAVDEGILQVANYTTPQPLDTFLRKRALEVGTAQMADLLMPEFSLLREAAGVGGDAFEMAEKALGANLNPFQRGLKMPVVFWSGIMDATGEKQSVRFTVPDHFDGQLRLMAVASSLQAAGSSAKSTIVRGPFVLQPNVITAAAPGDIFEVSVGVTNALPTESGEADIAVKVQPTKHVVVVGETTQTLTLAPGREGRARFQVKATDALGGAELVFLAESGEHTLSRTATLSVRPPVPYRTTLNAGMGNKGSVEVNLERSLRPELATQKATAGYSPLILADGLQAWLGTYPHLCTEQLVSRVFPVLGLLGDPVMELNGQATLEQHHSVVASLQARQQANGGFGFWPGSSAVNDFASIYAMHFLTDAADLDITVPANMRATGLDYLRTLAAAQPSTANAYRQAYAIYILTRNGQVTTNYLTQLQEYLQKNRPNSWRTELAGAYMAAAYRQLKLNDLAHGLIGQYQFAAPNSDYEWDMDSALARNAQYVYLLVQHFPERLAELDDERIQRLVTPVSEGRFNTLSASYTMLALGAWGRHAAVGAGPLNLSAATVGADMEPLAASDAAVLRSVVPIAATRLLIGGARDRRLFYSATQSGYDMALPKAEVRQGMEIVREYLNDSGDVVTSAPQGAELTVRLRVRALDNRRHNNIAVVDMLPGGFEVLRESLRGGNNNWNTDYIDIREDRVVLYGSIHADASTFTYRVKVTGAGRFVIPPAFAESMYKPDLQAQSLAGQFEVHQP